MGALKWLAKHWSRDLSKLREEVQRCANDRVLLETQARQIQNLQETIRNEVRERVLAMGAYKDCEREFLFGLVRDLESIAAAQSLVDCRIQAVREKIGAAVGTNGGKATEESMQDATTHG